MEQMQQVALEIGGFLWQCGISSLFSWSSNLMTVYRDFFCAVKWMVEFVSHSLLYSLISLQNQSIDWTLSTTWGNSGPSAKKTNWCRVQDGRSLETDSVRNKSNPNWVFTEYCNSWITKCKIMLILRRLFLWTGFSHLKKEVSLFHNLTQPNPGTLGKMKRKSINWTWHAACLQFENQKRIQQWSILSHPHRSQIF